MNICHVVNHLTSTSNEASHAEAINKYTDHDGGVLAWLSANPNPLSDATRVDVIKSTGWQAMREARDVLGRYDVVHTHHPHSATRAELVAKSLGVSTVFTYGTVPGRYARRPRIGTVITNAGADYVTYVSETVRQSATATERWLNRPSDVVYTGVDMAMVRDSLESPPRYESDDVLVVAVGRLEPVKGFETLIRAMNGLEGFELVIAGGGTERDRYEHLAASNVTLLGEISRHDAIRLMADADIVAAPSYQEGFATVPLEAMAVETPVVLSKIAAYTQPFDKNTAYWVELGSENDLRETIRQAAEAGEVRVDKARQRVEADYSVENTVRAYADIYDRL